MEITKNKNPQARLQNFCRFFNPYPIQTHDCDSTLSLETFAEIISVTFISSIPSKYPILMYTTYLKKGVHVVKVKFHSILYLKYIIVCTKTSLSLNTLHVYP